MIFGTLPPSVSASGACSLTSAPIRPEWVVSGTPLARSAQLSSSIDGDSFTCIWDCTAGVFHWNFDCDETVHIIEGGVKVSWDGETVSLGPGDTAYFPAGSATLWSVETYVQKVAFLRIPPPRPVSLALRIWRKVQRVAGIGPGNSAVLSQPRA